MYVDNVHLCVKLYIGNVLQSIDYNAIKFLFIYVLGKYMCFRGMIIACRCQYPVYCHPPTIMWLGPHTNIEITTPYMKNYLYNHQFVRNSLV